MGQPRPQWCTPSTSPWRSLFSSIICSPQPYSSKIPPLPSPFHCQHHHKLKSSKNIIWHVLPKGQLRPHICSPQLVPEGLPWPKSSPSSYSPKPPPPPPTLLQTQDSSSAWGDLALSDITVLTPGGLPSDPSSSFCQHLSSPSPSLLPISPLPPTTATYCSLAEIAERWQDTPSAWVNLGLNDAPLHQPLGVSLQLHHLCLCHYGFLQ